MPILPREDNANSRELLDSRAPHDEFSFAELAQSYNFLNVSSYARVFTGLILREIRDGSQDRRVLDIGCGRGIGRQIDYQRLVRHATGEYWGLEPDTSVVPSPGLFDNFQQALMESAELPVDYFDVAYSSMVMEHVSDPPAFLAAVHRILKPGGIYLFLTPNADSLVPWLTRLSHRLRIDEFVLRLVKRTHDVQQYHYPVQFKVNTCWQVNRYASQQGFHPPEYAFIEGPSPRYYFPRPLRPLYRMLVVKRRLIRNPRRLVTMICRLTKRPAVPVDR